VSGLSIAFGGTLALQGAAFDVKAGEILGLIGPNGSGKTTMLNIMSGIYQPDAGQGTFMDKSLGALWGHPHRLARLGIARTFQTIRLIDSHSVLDNVLLGLGRNQETTGTAARRMRAQEILARHGLQQFENMQAGWLPYGVRRRVEIARAVASEPRMLLLDEPTAGMSPQERADVFKTVSELRDLGMAIVIVEHDVDMMSQYCDRLVVLDFGKVLAAGEPAKVLRMKEVVTAYVGGTA
jgi:branched-chain amino acid transport system permease protein